MMEEREIKLRIVRLTDMPDEISGVSAPRKTEPVEDDYIILVNANRTEEEQTETFIHEMLHIWHRDHFGEWEKAPAGPANVNELEAIRHAETGTMIRKMRKEETSHENG